MEKKKKVPASADLSQRASLFKTAGTANVGHCEGNGKGECIIMVEAWTHNLKNEVVCMQASRVNYMMRGK